MLALPASLSMARPWRSLVVVSSVSWITCGSVLASLSTAPVGAMSNIAEISQVLFTKLLLPFEVTSILILVAILGAVVLARKEEQE